MDDLTIFANFFIDTEERFLRMKDSFRSFCGINPEMWLLNIRGRYKKQAAHFLTKNINNEIIISFRSSSEGWFNDTQKMLKDLKTRYALLWVEDHINIAEIDYLITVINEMKAESADCLMYTFFEFGNYNKRFEGIVKKELSAIEIFDHTVETHQIAEKNLPGYCSISYVSIMKTSLFKKVILNPPEKRIWPIETPFDFEKGGFDTKWLPLRIALSKKELFASIDDDRGIEGYSLQSRGLYPIREIRKSYANADYKTLSSSMQLLKMCLIKGVDKVVKIFNK